MNILEFNRRLMQIEEELGLFPDTHVANPGWWDAVRYDVVTLVYKQIIDAAPQNHSPRRFATRLQNLAKRLALRIDLEIRIWLGQYDVLVYRAPRLTLDGRNIDTGLDQVIAACPGRKLVINTFPYRYDRAYASNIMLAPRPAELDELERRLNQEFGIQLDLDLFIRQRLTEFEINYRGYAKVLARVRPRLVLINQNGIEKALFRATREAKIPCLEVQHGLINAAQPAYSYPACVHGAGPAMFPDIIFMFSQFWIDACHYPARYRIAIGNDFFYPMCITPRPMGGAVLVISALKYHDDLVRWLRQIAPRVPQRRFLYKLHPAQAPSLVSIQKALSDLSNVEVHGADVTVQTMIAEASDVLLIQSTVAYEAVQAGRRLFIIPEQDYATHTDLMTLEGVNVVTDVDALVIALTNDYSLRDPPVFFEPFDSLRANCILKELLFTGIPLDTSLLKAPHQTN